MKENKIICLVLLFSMLTVFNSCVKVGEWFIGLNLQPNMENSPFEPGLNVFGVLKTGPGFDTINHHFEVQQLFDMHDGDYGIEIRDAKITLSRMDDNDSIIDYFYPEHKSDGLYFARSLAVLPAEKWFYTCKYDTFIVCAECIVPSMPSLMNKLPVIVENQIKFDVVPDTTAFMYLAYIMQDEHFAMEQKIANQVNVTSFVVEANWDFSESSIQLYLFAYDKNMMTYQTTSNTFFKPNAFRPSFSTVQGGFGTFGAISSSLYVIK